jgi:single-strand DNA-binding protein
MNKVILLGRLGKDGELKSTPNNVKILDFSVATTEVYRDIAGEKKTLTEWHNVAVIGKLAESISQYMKKGRMVLVEGRLRTTSWEKNNVKHYRTNIICHDIKLISDSTDKKSTESESKRKSMDDALDKIQYKSNEPSIYDPYSDIPF